MRSLLDVEGQFSEARCSKVLPLALAAYQENLPSHYSSQNHENKVHQASMPICQPDIIIVLSIFDKLENPGESVTMQPRKRRSCSTIHSTSRWGM